MWVNRAITRQPQLAVDIQQSAFRDQYVRTREGVARRLQTCAETIVHIAYDNNVTTGAYGFWSTIAANRL